MPATATLGRAPGLSLAETASWSCNACECERSSFLPFAKGSADILLRRAACSSFAGTGIGEPLSLL